MFIFTGDTHWSQNEIARFRTAEFRKLRKTLTKDDYLIICGDFGLLWEQKENKEERYWIDWLTNAQWTTLFVDGNHENHDRLNALPVQEQFGGKVGVVSDSVLHLKRGEIYAINDKKILAFGGAKSGDIASRKSGISWWSQELPTQADFDNAMINLARHDFKVDFIVSHTAPRAFAKTIAANSDNFSDNNKLEDETVDMLQQIADKTEFTMWFNGHFHREFANEKHVAVYKKILNENGKNIYLQD